MNEKTVRELSKLNNSELIDYLLRDGCSDSEYVAGLRMDSINSHLRGLLKNLNLKEADL